MPTQPSSDQEQAARLKLLEALLSLFLSAWMVWQVMVPKHAKQLLLMKVIHLARTAAAKAASLTGEASMGAELASGREPDGGYLIPHGLSKARDWLGKAYDRARGTTL